MPIEREVADIIHQELQSLGFQAELIGVTPQRPNVVCRLLGTGNLEKTLILTTHMDTVEPSGYSCDPWEAHIENGRMYGVGVADAKAQIVAMTYALSALRKAEIEVAGNIILALVVDEESGACSPYGTQYLLEEGILQGSAAIIGEPGNTKVAIGHRGLYRFHIQIRGEAAHTGQGNSERGEAGRNAILDMARFAQALSEQHLPETPSEAFPNRKSVLTFPTLIQGGTGINIVPSSCDAYGDVRLLPGLSVDVIKKIIVATLERLAITDYTLEDLLCIPAVETLRQAEIAQTLATAAYTITGVMPRVEGAGPACDGWMFVTRGIPTICGYGVACGGVHGADEWIEIESLRQVTEVYANAIKDYLGG
jgi:acetylornithine deacetylase/succinyl-diaminopimelate desuccinylase-like protein